MSTVKPNITITEDTEGFIFYDCTGKFSSSDNTEGYSIKNPDVSKFVKSYLYATTPSGTKWTITMSGDMPRTDGIGYLIRSSMVGGFITPGVWTFEYVIELADGTQYKSNTYKKLLTREVDCCVDKLRNKIDIRLLLQEDPYQRKIVLLGASLWAAKEAAKCQRFNDAQKIIDTVYKNCKCDCCL